MTTFPFSRAAQTWRNAPGGTGLHSSVAAHGLEIVGRPAAEFRRVTSRPQGWPFRTMCLHSLLPIALGEAAALNRFLHRVRLRTLDDYSICRQPLAPRAARPGDQRLSSWHGAAAGQVFQLVGRPSLRIKTRPRCRSLAPQGTRATEDSCAADDRRRSLVQRSAPRVVFFACRADCAAISMSLGLEVGHGLVVVC